MLFSSDEGYGNDKTTFAHTDTADDQSCATSCDPSDVALDTLSVATTSSTLLASSSDEPLSRDAASSTNHITASSLGVNDVTTRPAGNSRQDLSFVCRVEGDETGPPWLPATGGTLLDSDGLPSLQYGASGLLGLVYDRQSNASQSFATADHSGDRTAVQCTGNSASLSTSSSPRSSSSVAPALSSDEENVENPNLQQTDKVAAMSEDVVEYHRPQLSPESVIELHPQLNSTTNSAQCDLSGGCTSDVIETTAVDSLNDVTLLCNGDVNEHRLVRPTPSYRAVDEPAVSTSTAVLDGEDYLLPDSEETGHGLVNGWTNIHDDVDIGTTTDVATADVSQVPRTLQRITEISDACQTLHTNPPISDSLLTEAVATRDISQSGAALDETSTSLRCNGACESVDNCSVCDMGHLQSTTSDADDSCRVSRNYDDPSSRDHSDAMCDVNSNVTSSTLDISISGDDGKSDDSESRNIEQCHQVAEQLSTAWRNTAGCAEVLDGYALIDGELSAAMLSTATIHVR